MEAGNPGSLTLEQLDAWLAKNNVKLTVRTRKSRDNRGQVSPFNSAVLQDAAGRIVGAGHATSLGQAVYSAMVDVAGDALYQEAWYPR